MELSRRSISAIEDALNTAGWTTKSGHHSATIVLQSASTPNGNQICVRLKTTGNNCATVELLNVAATLIGQTNFLYPSTTGTVFRICCNKYQCFIWQSGVTTPRYHLAFGVPYVWPFMSGSVVGDCGWICGDSTNDTGTSTVNFRRCLRTQDSGGNNHTSVILNGTLLNLAAVTATPQFSCIGIHGLGYTNPNGGCTFADGSMIITEPMIGWGSAELFR